MRVSSWCLSTIFVAALILLTPSFCHAASLELYGTFHAMGVIVTVNSGDDPDGDAMATVGYRLSGSAGPYLLGHPLNRVTDTRFVGSLFWLEPGTDYDVLVTFSDPDGGPLDGVTVYGTASTRAEITIPSPSHSYYVSPNGNGTTCSQASPCSLVEGLDRAGPGEEVVLRGGIYYQGDITLPRSGAPGAPIIIRGYEGETAILDGGDPATFAWQDQGGGVYRANVNVSGTHLVVADGDRLFAYRSLSDLESLSWGIPGFYASGSTLYVRLAGDADPNGAEMVVSRYDEGLVIEEDYIYFLDLTARHYGLDSGKAFKFDNASDNLVQGCTFAVNDTGVYIRGDSHRNVIQDNEFYDTIPHWPWDAAKEDGGLETGGLRFATVCTGRGTVVRRNVFHGFFDGVTPTPGGTAAVTNETDVYENLIYNIGDDGMSVDGQASNVRIWKNTIHDVLVGISLAPVFPGPVYAIHNLIYRTGEGDNRYDGNSFKFGTSSGPSGTVYLYHNTVDSVSPDASGIRFSSSGSWTVWALNNIWSCPTYALVNRNPDQPVNMDYDNLWNGNRSGLVDWDDREYDTLAAFTAATGQEQHGLSVDPGFANAGEGNYALNDGSTLIDAGVVIPGINDGYSGEAPDIGAIEYEDATDITIFAVGAQPGSRIWPGIMIALGLAALIVAIWLIPVGPVRHRLAAALRRLKDNC